MAHFLFQGSYSAAAMKAMIDAPQDRSKFAKELIESGGGTFHHMFFSLGENDYYILCELPDASAAAAVSMSVGATGSMTEFKSIPLLTMAEAMTAMTRAKSAKYSSPLAAGST